MTDPDVERWIEDARRADLVETARRLQPELRRAGNDWNAACPACGGKDRNEFVVTPRKGVFLCRKSGEGGDAIKMVQHAIACDFMAAVEWINGTKPPRGEGRRTDPDVIRERREERHSDRVSAARDDQRRSTRAVTTARDLFDLGRDIFGTQGEAYFAARGIRLTAEMAMNLRFTPSLEYRGYADEQADQETSLGTFPCVLAAVRNLDGEIIACHRTYLDPDKPKGLSPPGDQRRNKKKKIMGRPKGGTIALGYLGEAVALGEGIETVASWFQLYDGVADVTPVAAYSLGNMAGNATGTLPHPSAPGDEQSRVPNGEPAMDDPGVRLPPEAQHVILIGDGDSDPVRTRAFLLTAARRFRAEGREVSISMAPSGTDWNDQIVRQIAGEAVEPPTLQSFEEFEREALALMRPPFKSQFGATWMHEVARAKPQRNWLVKNLILAKSFGIIYGPPGSGKSFLTSDLMLSCAAHGLPGLPDSWFNYRLRRFGVIYVVAEGRDDFEIRLHAWRAENGIAADEIVPFVFLPTSIDMRSSDADTKRLAAEIRQIDTIMRERCGVGVGATVIDTVARALAGGNENASEVMGGFVINCGKLAEETGAAVIGVHHGGKEGGKGPRGHEALHGAADFEIEVAPASEGQPNAWTLRKLKAGPFGAQHKFRLKQIRVGHDEEGDPITSCVVVDFGNQSEPEKPAKQGGFRINAGEREWLQAFDAAFDKHAMMPPASCEAKPNVTFVVPIASVREAFKSRYAATEEGDEQQIETRLRARWSRATKGLLRFGVIGTNKQHVWMTGKRVQGFRLLGADEIVKASDRVDQPLPADNSPSDAVDEPEVVL